VLVYTVDDKGTTLPSRISALAGKPLIVEPHDAVSYRKAFRVRQSFMRVLDTQPQLKTILAAIKEAKPEDEGVEDCL
jgi:hypothetical protein